ncbi:hypothetical protein, partial [Gillisia sp. CAL575]|uniref:hypothetical protein n=1 Tax=Gillisia sp. CAL575 TaxID=985255 RepID=UPI0003A82D23
MEITRLLVAGLVATSLMTAFSYIISNIRNRQFREPELLNIVLSRSDFFRIELSKNSSAGWILHYLIGWLFVIVFRLIWKLDIIPISFLSGGLLGFAAGIIGVLGWKMMFLLSKNPPDTNWDVEYYSQLIVAHIIFGLSVALVYNIW